MGQSNTDNVIVQFKMILGEVPYELSENVGNDEFILNCYYKKEYRKKPDVIRNKYNNYYFGMSLETVMDSSIDALGEKIMKRDDFGLQELTGILPSLEKDSYFSLGGMSSRSKVYVSKQAGIIPQQKELIFNFRQKPVLFAHEFCQDLKNHTPTQTILEGWMPIVINSYCIEGIDYELMYFVEPLDSGTQPFVWARLTTNDRGNIQEKYFFISLYDIVEIHIIENIDFYSNLVSTLIFWDNYIAGHYNLIVPDIHMLNILKGSILQANMCFTGNTPHYGHQFYSMGIHDHFPPTVIWALEAYLLYGQKEHVESLIKIIFTDIIDDLGRISFRQNAKGLFGFSAAEYGQLFWIINKAISALNYPEWMNNHIDKLKLMVDFILTKREKSANTDNFNLVLMCAEADNNNEEYVYASNNLWLARGILELSEIFNSYRPCIATNYTLIAKDLKNEILLALKEKSIESKYGFIVPFRLDYPPLVFSLSNCKNIDTDLNEYTDYINGNCEHQNLRENTYANYRYYPEMLSSRMLDIKDEKVLDKIRCDRGGESLGMTRFFDKLDNWPILNYARYMFENEQYDKFHMTLYAHILYHGDSKMINYFEQVGLDGVTQADACVPCMLTAPIMTAWMLCYEDINKTGVFFLRGIPKSWYSNNSAFGIKNTLCKYGEVSVQVNTKNNIVCIDISFEKFNDLYDATSKIYVDTFYPEKSEIKIIRGQKSIIRILDNAVLEIENNIKKIHIEYIKEEQ